MSFAPHHGARNIPPVAPPRGPANLPTTPAKKVTELACQLQTAIGNGQVQSAGLAASQLARQRAPLSIDKRDVKNSRKAAPDEVRIKVHIQNCDIRAGHVLLDVHSTMSVRLLKNKIFQALGFPPETQRWIIGRSLAKDEDRLCDLTEISTGASFFLYLMSACTVGLTKKGLQDQNTEELQSAAANVPMSPKAASESSGRTLFQHTTQRQESIDQELNARPRPITRMSSWTCSRCTYADNQTSSPQCEVCDAVPGI